MDRDSRQWLNKPKLGREGQDISRNVKKNDPHYITQEYFEVQKFDGMTPVIGSWVIGDESAGIGIREDVGITTNNSSFVPHYFV